MNSKSKTVAFIGVMAALEFVAMFLETYVFVALIPLAPPCMLSLSVAITLSVYADWKNMFLGGTIMGCCSFVIAALIGNAVFILPWISILPRIFIGIVAFGVSALVKRIFRSSENKFLKNAIRDQYMTAGYIEKGEMHGNHIEKMKLAQVQTEGGNDYFLIEDGELLSILSTTEKVALRMDRHKLTEIEYTNEFTPEIFERVEKNATLLTQEEKEPPLKKLYKDTPEIKLKEGVTSLEQVNYIPKFRGKEQTQS